MLAGGAGGGADFGEFKARRVKNRLFPCFGVFLLIVCDTNTYSLLSDRIVVK
jgi:hypothetical protein